MTIMTNQNENTTPSLDIVSVPKESEIKLINLSPTRAYITSRGKFTNRNFMSFGAEEAKRLLKTGNGKIVTAESASEITSDKIAKSIKEKDALIKSLQEELKNVNKAQEPATSSDERDEIIKELKALGIPFGGNSSTESLKAKLNEAKLNEAKGEPKEIK